MSQMTPSQARIVDPVLSTHALGYRFPGLIARLLFPLAPVGMYGGKVIQFGKEAFKLYGSARAPGSVTKRVQFGYTGKSYAIVPSALEVPVPREIMQDASKVPGIDLGTRATSVALRSLNLEHEYNAAQIARDASNYGTDNKTTLSGTSCWTGSASDPVSDVVAAVNAVRSKIGIKPNLVVLSATAFAACQTNSKILDRTKYTGRDSITEDILARLFAVQKVVVGEAMVADASDDFGDVWGDDVIVGYTNVSNSPNQEEPSYGYTYVIQGHPMVEQPYWDNGSKSWIYGVSFDNSPVLAATDAGYLIKDAGKAQS